jgi:hypothetical protein
VPDSTDTGRSVRNKPRRHWLASGESRYVVVAAFIAAALGTLIGGHLYGRYLSSRETRGRDNAIEEMRTESQKLKTQSDSLSAQITQLQTKLANAQAAVEAIMPSKNTYNFDPNQTRIVADGHLTIGLIGSPGNDNVTLNINGKQQTVGAGQVINVEPDCQVGVQSFDMFKAVLTASCAGQK